MNPRTRRLRRHRRLDARHPHTRALDRWYRQNGIAGTGTPVRLQRAKAHASLDRNGPDSDAGRAAIMFLSLLAITHGNWGRHAPLPREWTHRAWPEGAPSQ